MKKIHIRLEYRGNVYESETSECNQETEEELLGLLEMASNGELNHLTFKSFRSFYNVQHYFPKEVLKESVFGLVYED